MAVGFGLETIGGRFSLNIDRGVYVQMQRKFAFDELVKCTGRACCYQLTVGLFTIG